MRERVRTLVAVASLGLLALATGPARAQDTNLTILQQLARECIGELPAEIDSLVLEASDRMPYLRTALVESWQSAGREVYAVGATPPQAAHLPRLAFTVEEASVEYAAVGRPNVSRRVHLALQYTLTEPDGRIVLDERCTRAVSDTIERSAIERVENQTHVETQGDRPPAGVFRRIIEPAVITAATAIGVYLFFTLRSQSADE